MADGHEIRAWFADSGLQDLGQEAQEDEPRKHREPMTKRISHGVKEDVFGLFAHKRSKQEDLRQNNY